MLEPTQLHHNLSSNKDTTSMLPPELQRTLQDISAQNSSEIYQVALSSLSAESDIFVKELALRDRIVSRQLQVQKEHQFQKERKADTGGAFGDFRVSDLNSFYVLKDFLLKFSIPLPQEEIINRKSEPYKSIVKLTVQNCARYLLIDTSSNNYFNHCKFYETDPDANIRAFFKSKVIKSEREYIMSTNLDSVESYQPFFDSYNKIHNHREAKELVSKIKMISPGFFDYVTTIEKNKKAIVHEWNRQMLEGQPFGDEGSLSIDTLWNQFSTVEYVRRQTAVLNQLSEDYSKHLMNSKARGTERALSELSAKRLAISERYEKLIRALKLPEIDQPIVIEGSIQNSEIHDRPTNEIYEHPIKNYLNRVVRWLNAPKTAAVRKFRDKGRATYQKLPAQAIEKARIKHGFSLKVDELLSGAHGPYAYTTSRGLAMIAKITKEGEREGKIGVISYAISPQGRCYHRMFSEKDGAELLTEDLGSLFEESKIDFDEDEPDSEITAVNQDLFSIEGKIATVKDRVNKCTIQVIQRFKTDPLPTL